MPGTVADVRLNYFCCCCGIFGKSQDLSVNADGGDGNDNEDDITDVADLHAPISGSRRNLMRRRSSQFVREQLEIIMTPSSRWDVDGELTAEGAVSQPLASHAGNARSL